MVRGTGCSSFPRTVFTCAVVNEVYFYYPVLMINHRVTLITRVQGIALMFAQEPEQGNTLCRTLDLDLPTTCYWLLLKAFSSSHCF